MRTWLVAGLLGVVLTAPSCADTGSKTSPAPTAESKDVIVLGLIGAFSSADADTARQARLGAELAVAQLNASGGVLDRRLDLRTEDDQGRAEVALDRMNVLIAAGVTIGIGPTTSESASALLDLARQDKMLYISPSASSPLLDLPGNVTSPDAIPANLLRSVPSDDLQSSALVVVAGQSRDQLPEDPSLKVGQSRCTRIVIAYQKDGYGTPIFQLAQKRAIERNIAVVKSVELDPADATDRTLLGSADQVGTAAADLDPPADCQIVIAQPQLAGAYMRAFRGYISDATIAAKRSWGAFTTLGSDGFTQDSFVVAGRVDPADPNSDTAGNGSVAVTPNTRPLTQTYNVFRENYRARNPNSEPGQFATTAYDSVIMLALAMERAGSATDRAALRRALAELSIGQPSDTADLLLLLTRVRSKVAVNYQGVSGDMDFLRTGAVNGDFAIGRITNNRFVQYKKTLQSSSLGE